MRFTKSYLATRKRVWTEGKKKPQKGLLEIMLDLQMMEDAVHGTNKCGTAPKSDFNTEQDVEEKFEE